MDRVAPQMAVFKYKHGGKVALSKKSLGFVVVTTVLAAVVAFFARPEGFAAFLVPLIAFFNRTGTLSVGPRYLVCGPNIVYYANVTHATLSEAGGRLDIVTNGGKTFSIEREKFPTNARKAPKVAANKAAKFGKATGKIIDKIRRAAPNAVIV